MNSLVALIVVNWTLFLFAPQDMGAMIGERAAKFQSGFDRGYAATAVPLEGGEGE